MSEQGRTINSVIASGVRELVGAEVLVVDKDITVQKGMTQLLSAASLHVTSAGTPAEALALLGKKFFSVAIVDLDTPKPGGGLEIIEQLKAESPTTMIILLTPRKSFDDSVRAIRVGAVDIVWKSPEQVQYLLERVMDAAGRSVGKREVNSLLEQVRSVYDDFLKRFMDAERRALDASGGVSSTGNEAVRILVVSPEEMVKDTLAKVAPHGFTFDSVHSGGAALDRCSNTAFHMAIIAETLPDLPGSMVVRSVKAQSPDTLVLQYSGPGPGGRVDIVETTRTIPVIAEFTGVEQLAARLEELAEAFRAKARERQYTQAFRERHYDFLRRYVELKLKIDQTLSGS